MPGQPVPYSPVLMIGHAATGISIAYYHCINIATATFALLMRLAQNAYKTSYSLLLWATMVCALVTCPVKKAIKSYQQLPVSSQANYNTPGVIHTCTFHRDAEHRNSNTENQQRGLFTAMPVNNYVHILAPANETRALLYTTIITRNGPPLFLRHRQILI